MPKIPNQKLTLSIIIPTLNCETVISQCLNSIFHLLGNNGLINYEVIIKDGISTDKTETTINKFQNQLPLRFITKSDTGIYDAMNQAIVESNGKWLYFMGADDVLLKGILELIFVSKQNSYDIIYGKVIAKHRQTSSPGKFDLKKLFTSTPPHQGTLFKSELFRKYGDYNEKYSLSADYERFLYFFSRPEIKIKYIDVFVAVFNEFGISGKNKDIAFFRDRHLLIGKYFKATFDATSLNEIVGKAKRQDAILLIDDGRDLYTGFKMYVSTIRVNDNYKKHLRYIIGSLKIYIFKKFN